MAPLTRWTESIGGLTVITAAIIFVLYGTDRSLANLEKSEVRSEARHNYDSGNRVLQVQ
jgi:hypothetical protein